MKGAKIILFSFIAISILLVKYSFAYYEINCDIDVIPYRYDELITTDSFRLNLTFKSIGNTSFEEFTGIWHPFVNVSILNPNNQILENYYTFNIPILDLATNDSFNYEPPFIYKNKTGFQLFEMQMPGTWTIVLKIIFPKPLNETLYTYTPDIIRTNGECRKYFYVKDIGQYQDEQIRKDEITTNKNYQTKTENLNTAILILSIILALDLVRKFAEKKKNIIIFISGIVIAIYYLSIEPVQFLFFTLPLYAKIIFATLMIIFSASVYFNKPKGEIKIVYILFLFLILILTLLFLIRMLTTLLSEDYLLGTIGIIASSMVIFSILSELNETKT